MPKEKGAVMEILQDIGFNIGDTVYHTKRDDDRYRIVKAEVMKISLNSNGTFISTKECGANYTPQDSPLVLVFKSFEEARSAILNIYLKNIENALSLYE